jgi:hypothetical protein
MADKKERKEFEKVTTAAGITKYCFLNEPREKYMKPKEHEYQCTLILPADSDATVTHLDGVKEVVKLFPYLEAVAKTAYQEGLKLGLEACKTEKARKAYTHIMHLPFEEELDEHEKETGNMMLKTKKNGEYKNKDDELVTSAAPAIYDAKGTFLEKAPAIFSGSEVKLSLLIKEFIGVGGKSGVSMQLLAAQIIELKSGRGRTAADHGFEQEEGYTAQVMADAEGDF